MRVLLVKTSSLGDVIHNLPVASDLVRLIPGVEIDWVVEEAFAAIPAMHPGVRRVLPVAVRRWRRAMLSANTWRELRAFRRSLRKTDYDAVLDTQGLLKSALIARQARGPTFGLAADSAREPIAARFYQRGFSVSRGLHAVKRNRLLAASAFGYAVPDSLDYGLADHAVASPTAILLTATSRDAKRWDDESWVVLGRWLTTRGLGCRLPAGSPDERNRATAIAHAIAGAEVVPPSTLPELAAVIGSARIVIGVDTGLIHLAAALGRPCIGIYKASNPLLTGVLGDCGVINLGKPGMPPSAGEVMAAAEALL